jgi:biotin-dependent carboxylase-like uncharacterized protein
MSRLEITAVGPATTIQDEGRYGAQRFGLSPSGAMDRAALATANCLVGNPIFGAAIEVGPFGAAFTARDGAVRVALAGAARDAEISGRKVEFHRSLLIAENETLRLGLARGGVFSYLAIEGGIHGEPVFGSLSVTARAELGSPFPRPLQAADRLEANDPQPMSVERKLDVPASQNTPIRVVLGPQDDEFDASVIASFLDSEWMIAAASDRMGYRIEGPPLLHNKGHNIVSDGTVTGSIQVPGSGQPIVLMPDRGTAGGYPKIATVISADIGRFAQICVGQSFRFCEISIEDAQMEAWRFDEYLKALPTHISDVRDIALDVAALQNANLAGVAINAIDSATWQTAFPT